MSSFILQNPIYSLLNATHPNAFERFLGALNKQVDEPPIFGWFHWFWIVLTLVSCVLVCLYTRKLSAKQVRVIVGGVAALLLILETYKQLVASYNLTEDTWKYNWTAFPFQFCSTPMYIMTLAAVWKKGKVQNALYAFLATYGTFAGLIVLANPTTVYGIGLFSNLQTMIHHCAMIVIGVLLFASGSAKIEHTTVLYGAPVFVVLLTLAFIMNTLYADYGDLSYNFNMFYIAAYSHTYAPFEFLDELIRAVPYFFVPIGYALGFTAAGWAIAASGMLVVKIKERALQAMDKKQAKLHKENADGAENVSKNDSKQSISEENV